MTPTNPRKPAIWVEFDRLVTRMIAEVFVLPRHLVGPSIEQGGFLVPRAVLRELVDMGVLDASFYPPMTWRDLPLVAFVTPAAWLILVLLSQVVR